MLSPSKLFGIFSKEKKVPSPKHVNVWAVFAQFKKVPEGDRPRALRRACEAAIEELGDRCPQIPIIPDEANGAMKLLVGLVELINHDEIVGGAMKFIDLAYESMQGESITPQGRKATRRLFDESPEPQPLQMSALAQLIRESVNEAVTPLKAEIEALKKERPKRQAKKRCEDCGLFECVCTDESSEEFIKGKVVKPKRRVTKKTRNEI
jgi:hypothetical protein